MVEEEVARASREYTLSSCNSGAMRGRRKPRGSRSPSKYPHWRKVLSTRSRSGSEPLELSISAVPEVLDFAVAIRVQLPRIKDADGVAGDSGCASLEMTN